MICLARLYYRRQLVLPQLATAALCLPPHITVCLAQVDLTESGAAIFSNFLFGVAALEVPPPHHHPPAGLGRALWGPPPSHQAMHTTVKDVRGHRPLPAPTTASLYRLSPALPAPRPTALPAPTPELFRCDVCDGLAAAGL